MGVNVSHIIASWTVCSVACAVILTTSNCTFIVQSRCSHLNQKVTFTIQALINQSVIQRSISPVIYGVVRHFETEWKIPICHRPNLPLRIDVSVRIILHTFIVKSRFSFLLWQMLLSPCGYGFRIIMGMNRYTNHNQTRRFYRRSTDWFLSTREKV